jgi:ATP-binding cassette, subfamily B, bacterial HlyB/CyaB
MSQVSRHTALLCLEMACRHHGVDLSVERLIHDYAVGTEEVDTPLLLRIARESGFKARAVTLTWEELIALGQGYPVIARLRNGNCVLVGGYREDSEGSVAVVDPLADRPGFIFVSRDKFLAAWDGETIFLKRAYKLRDESQPFSLRWFVPEIFRQGRIFGHVSVAGFMLNVVGLVTPLFFQVVIDKVLVHNSRSTLVILGIGVICGILFEALLTYLRDYVALHASNKIDIRLAQRTFSHLLKLPLGFFETSSAGVVTKHMQQVDEIREFLTGRLFYTILDSWALLVFIPMLFFYSVTMACIVLGFSLFVALAGLVIMPAFRRKLNALYMAEGRRQSLLVECIHGMHTVKSLALEPSLRRRWERNSALAVSLQQQVGKLSLTAQAIIGYVEKMLTVVIIWVGALMVFDNKLTVGELVAINIIAGRVSGPLVKIVGMISQFQQVGLSVRMLGEIMNHKPEELRESHGLRPAFSGEVTVQGLTFHYPGMQAPALNKISIHIPAGQVIGIVGRSGSGKTTFLRLLQGLYLPQGGSIRYDGHEIRELDLAHLRQSLGVVLQESFFFRGSVRENIAFSAPGASFSEVVAAARIAGADEFIQQLPQGYETLLEENASNLSGGQRQRLAIARALLSNPPIIIFDEATSALDPESEAIVQGNMSRIAKGRTVIIVSHRLSALVDADRIHFFEKGQVTASGTHEELIRDCAPYRRLWRQQQAGGDES